MSWVDCASTGKNFARGIFMLGEHSKTPAELKPSPEPKLVFPFDAPGFVLNHTTVSMFNSVFFHKQRKSHVKTVQDYEPFFYPLDAVLHWNRMYGKRGLVQFQYAIPWKDAKEGTIAILREIASRVWRVSSPCEGLRRHTIVGDDELSAGWNHVALDFPIKPDLTFPLLQRLGDMTLEFGGRLYPAKDAAMNASQFQTFYPEWERFARFRDPLLTSSFWERVTDSTGAHTIL